MKRIGLIAGFLAIFLFGNPLPAQEKPAAATNQEITLKGPMMTEAACYANPPPDADKTVVLMVVGAWGRI